jgi:hypothetical protein
MLEIIKMVTNKKPLFLEVNVPPLCSPFIVGNPSKEGGLLRWVEQPLKNDTVLAWGIKEPPEEIVKDMTRLVLERSKLEGWGSLQPTREKAEERLKGLGIEEVTLSGNLLHPQDPSMLGSLIIVGDTCFPVIHNARRGLCWFSPQ